MPRSSRLEDKYNNNNSGLVATTYQSAIDELNTNIESLVLDQTDLISNSPTKAPSQKSVKEYVDKISYKEQFITENTTISSSIFDSPGQILRYKIPADITITPPAGFSFLFWDPNIKDYVSLGVNTSFFTDNLNSNIYELFNYGNNIYINNLHSYTPTLVKLVSNTTTDVATNYNTANWLPVTFSDGSSLIRISNKFPMGITNSTYTPNYTGYFNISHNLHIRSSGSRVHLSARIFNITTSQVVTVSDYTYIRSTDGHNLDTLKLSTLDIPCVAGQSYQLQLKRQGTRATSATLSNVNQSFITIKSTTF